MPPDVEEDENTDTEKEDEVTTVCEPDMIQLKV